MINKFDLTLSAQNVVKKSGVRVQLDKYKNIKSISCCNFKCCSWHLGGGGGKGEQTHRQPTSQLTPSTVRGAGKVIIWLITEYKYIDK